jgi:hypothetical protein
MTTDDIASSGAGPLAAKHAAAGLLLLLWAAAAGVGLDLVAGARGCAPGR